MRRRGVPGTLGVLALALASHALAQGGVDFNFDPIDWLTRMVVLVEQLGLLPAVETLAYSLAAVLFAYGMVRAIWFGRGSELSALAGRTLLVVALIVLLPTLRNVVFNTWTSVYTWSSGVWGTSSGGTLSNLLEAAEDAEDVLPSFLAASYAVETAALGQSNIAAEAGLPSGVATGAASTLAQLVRWCAQLIFTVMLPILFGIYSVVVFISGMTVLFGLVLLPLSIVLLMVPGGAASSWMGAWVRMTLGALFVVAFLPVAVSIVVELGVTQPLARTTTSMEQSLDQFNEASASLDAAFDDLQDAVLALAPGGVNPNEKLEQAKENFWLTAKGAFSGIVGILLGWVFGILTIVVGFLIGLFLMLRLERYVTGFLGGLTSGVGVPGFLGRAATLRLVSGVAAGVSAVDRSGSRAVRGTSYSAGRVTGTLTYRPSDQSKLEPPRARQTPSSAAPLSSQGKSE